LLELPDDARVLYVLAHGAGAGMRHPFLEHAAQAFARHGIGTYRYEFPYMKEKRSRPDSPKVAQAVVREAVRHAGQTPLPLLAGGKSFGGRMTSQAQAEEPLPGVKGLVFLGFPLHPPGRPGTERAEHLAAVAIPMLFLQGTRDEFAKLDLIETVVRGIGKRATLHLIPDGDHSFKVPKRAGTPETVMEDLARTIQEWATGIA
jgi:predicted alpha/beta-hydrolase family hydrolase